MSKSLLLALAAGAHVLVASSPAPVCVTGAGGYVASELVKQLLEIGYDVKGTVRSLSSTKYDHLKKLSEALPGSLELMEADLLKPGSFDECAKGVDYLFHTASPFHFESEDMTEDMMRPAVEGTNNVMSSAKKADVKRVILTSSFAAVNSFTPDDKPQNGELYSEGDWNTFTDNDVWDANPAQAYIASKALAETAALKAALAGGIELVAILPSLVLGPQLSSRADSSFSIKAGVTLANGELLSAGFPVCDVRDVGRAHIAGMTSPQGRYIVSQPNTLPASLASELITAAFPGVPFAVADKEEDKVILDNSKIKGLIGELIPYEKTLADMVRSLWAAGLAVSPTAAKKEL